MEIFMFFFFYYYCPKILKNKRNDLLKYAQAANEIINQLCPLFLSHTHTSTPYLSFSLSLFARKFLDCYLHTRHIPSNQRITTKRKEDNNKSKCKENKSKPKIQTNCKLIK